MSSQPPSVLSYTDTGVEQAPTAATSLVMRPAQPESFCQAGFGHVTLQPLPVPRPSERSPHTFSLKPRAPPAFFSVVPPTAVTVGRTAGKLGDSPKTNSSS